MSSVDRTQHVYPCAIFQISASPLTFVLHLPYTLTGCDTAGAGHHHQIRSAPSSPADVAVAQNDLPPSCVAGSGPVVHPASRSATSPSLLVTVMIRPAADETTTRDGRPGWPKQARHICRRRTGFVCEVKSFQWQRLHGLQDATA